MLDVMLGSLHVYSALLGLVLVLFWLGRLQRAMLQEVLSMAYRGGSIFFRKSPVSQDRPLVDVHHHNVFVAAEQLCNDTCVNTMAVLTTLNFQLYGCIPFGEVWDAIARVATGFGRDMVPMIFGDSD